MAASEACGIGLGFRELVGCFEGATGGGMVLYMDMQGFLPQGCKGHLVVCRYMIFILGFRIFKIQKFLGTGLGGYCLG